MMLHVDGSRHRGFQGLDQYQDLIVIFDDATSEVYDVQLVEEESTVTVMAALKRVVESRGLFCSLYSDRGSHMAWTPKAGGLVDREHPTQIARALKQLGIDLILAYSPQARGRCERIFGTWQGRLPQEFRLRGITTVKAANEFLRNDWIAMHDASFSVKAEQTGTAFLPYHGNRTGADLLSAARTRHRQRQHGAIREPLFTDPAADLPLQPGAMPVLVCEHLDHTIRFTMDHILGHYDAAGQLLLLPHPTQTASHVANAPTLMKADARRERQIEERKKNQKRKKKAA